jgi:hypothetical protein
MNITNNGNLNATSTGGTTTVTLGSSSSGSIVVNAYTTGGSLSGAKTIASAGKWSTTSITAGTDQLGPYYGEVYIKPLSDSAKATVKSGNAVATISDPQFNNDGGTSGQFILTASGDVNAPTVSEAGYISSTTGTK